MTKSTMYKIIRSTDEVKTDLSYIGGVIKRRRIEKNLTQEIIARGICSVSYLSKIENCKMKPDPMVIKEVSARVGIYFDKKVDAKSLQTYIETVFTMFFYRDAKEMENFLEAIQVDEFYLVDGMIRYLIAIKKKDNDLSSEYREILKPLFNTMPKDLQYSFVIALMIDHYQMHQFNEAFNHARLLENEYLPVDMMQFLYHYYSYISYLNANIFFKAHDHYTQAQHVVTKLNHPYYFSALYLEKQYHVMRMEPFYDISNIENYLIFDPAEPLKNKVNLMIINDAIQKDKPPLKMYETSLKDEAYYHLKYLKMIHYNEITSVFDSEVPYVATPYKVMAKLSQIMDEEARVEIIKSKAIPLMKRHENIAFLNQLFEEVITYYQSHARYKETLALIKKQEKIIQNIQRFEAIHLA